MGSWQISTSSTLRGVMLAVALALPASAAAQVGGEWPEDGHMTREAVATIDAVSRCVTTLELSDPAEIEVSECRVSAVDSLELAEGRTALVVRYARWARGPAIAWRDSVQVEEVVLFAVDDGSGTSTAEWHRVGLHNFIVHPVQRGRHLGQDVLVVHSCVRGTGGCVEDVLLRQEGRWQSVELTFVDELGAHLPAGHALHKGRRIDPTTLDFDQPIATRDDANCCPRASLVGVLVLDGTRLKLGSPPELRRREGDGAGDPPDVPPHF